MDFILEQFNLPQKKQKISDLHGKVLEAQTSYGDIAIVPLYHPTAAFYNRDLEDALQEDLSPEAVQIEEILIIDESKQGVVSLNCVDTDSSSPLHFRERRSSRAKRSEARIETKRPCKTRSLGFDTRFALLNRRSLADSRPARLSTRKGETIIF